MIKTKLLKRKEKLWQKIKSSNGVKNWKCNKTNKLNCDSSKTQIVTKLKMWPKSNNSKCGKTQKVTKLENLNGDKTQNVTKLKIWQNSKTQIVTTPKNSCCDKILKPKLWPISKTQIVTNLENSKCDKAQIVTKLKTQTLT